MPVPDRHKLTQNYWATQQLRVRSLAAKLDQRESAIKKGLQVPDDGDMPIGTGRHVHATVIFIDICGFSARKMSSMAEQENALWMISMFFAEAVRIIEEYGGTVEKNTGDGLLAYIGDQGGASGRGQSCDTALAALMTLRRVTDMEINPLLEARGISKIEYRASADWGPITVAQVGAQQRFGSIIAIGSTANLASKVMKIAGPGEVVVGLFVAQNLSEIFRQWLRPCPEASGWTYGGGANEKPYPLYRYTGHWTGPR